MLFLSTVPSTAGTPRVDRGSKLSPQHFTSTRRRACSRIQSGEQEAILSTIKGVTGRGQGGLTEEQLAKFTEAVDVLENDIGIENPTASEILRGRWKLLFTSKPGTESPIQRTFTGIDAFRIYQDIDDDDGKALRIRNVVRFPDWLGALRVEAEGSTDSLKIPGFVPRRGEGLPLFGKSMTYPPDRRDTRIDFWFDRAAFKLTFVPFKIPYPVPFRLFGDETKGWLDVTYLAPDGNFRLSRGNKGTLFVLAKEERSTKQTLLDAIAEGAVDHEILKLIEKMKVLNPTENPGQSSKIQGKWNVIWTKQGKTANPLQKAFSDFRQWQTIEEKEIKNVAILLPGLVRVKAQADVQSSSATRTMVYVKKLAFEIPFREIQLESPDQKGFIEWLYLDDDMRITKGSEGTLYVHLRESS